MFRSATAPLFLAAALAALALLSRAGEPARVHRVLVDPGRDAAPALESLEGMGASAARRILIARREGGAIRSAADLASVPGVGARSIHRWHADLAFREDRR